MQIQYQKTHNFFIMILFCLALLLYIQNAVATFIYKDETNNSSTHNIQKNNNQQTLTNQTDQTVNKKDKKLSLHDEEKNNSPPWSNAFNLSKLWGTEVDPRTGVMTAYFKLGRMISNIGHGPNINLQLNYNSNSSANLDGLGTGWGWNLTHFNPVTDQLSTSGGQSFYLQKRDENHWYPLYHKLPNFEIDGDKSSHFTIIYANGSRETLSHDGYEVRQEQQNGWGINFIYQQGTHLLQSIVDDQKNNIILKRERGYLDVINRNSDGKPVVVRVKSHNKNINKIIFFSQYESVNPTIILHYKNKHLTKIIYPTGLEKTFIFNCTDMKLPIKSETAQSLCVVSTEAVVPDTGQIIKTNYSYSHSSINEHNYLGFNSGNTFFHLDIARSLLPRLMDCR